MKNPANILFVLTDDQGYWTLGCGGNADIHTPNLDRLAARGMRFESFFCASPVCSPARATLLTGQIPSKHGILDWLYGRDEQEYLQGQALYTDVLAANGYACGMSGKWHIGTVYKPPECFAHFNAIKYGSSPYYNAIMVQGGVDTQTEGYLTDIITDDAIGFIEAQAAAGVPFYSSVHYNAPHRPWQDNHPKEIYDLYEGCTFDSIPDEAPHPWRLSHGGERDKTPREENLKWYYAAITAMDRSVGRLIDCLEKLGIRENTLIVFTSDNGFNCGHHGIWGKGNGTFPQNLYDTSVKVPAIFSQPGVIPEGSVCPELVSQYDVFPTLLDYLGIGLPNGDDKPGRSFVPLLCGEAAAGFNRVVVYDEYGPVRMIRTKEHKYIHRYPYGPHELYDLAADPDETVNLANQEAMQDTLHSLKADMEAWFKRYTDPDRDGRQFAVTGDGQLDVIGAAKAGKNPFGTDRNVTGAMLTQLYPSSHAQHGQRVVQPRPEHIIPGHGPHSRGP
jgi:arylsulfatase A-like enzyme